LPWQKPVRLPLEAQPEPPAKRPHCQAGGRGCAGHPRVFPEQVDGTAGWAAGDTALGMSPRPAKGGRSTPYDRASAWAEETS